MSQTDCWAEALAVGRQVGPAARKLWLSSSASRLVFTGCGSTYYLSLAAAAIACSAGLPAIAAPASEIWLATRSAILAPCQTLLVAISRSGETSETLRAVSAFCSAGGRAVLAVTCHPNSALVPCSDLAAAVPGAQERSTAQTRSFTSMLVLCRVLIDALAGTGDAAERLAGLPSLGRRLLADHAGLAERLGRDMSLQRFFFLGNGPLYGVAQEAMLKMKEMSLSHSEG